MSLLDSVVSICHSHSSGFFFFFKKTKVGNHPAVSDPNQSESVAVSSSLLCFGICVHVSSLCCPYNVVAKRFVHLFAETAGFSL